MDVKVTMLYSVLNNNEEFLSGRRTYLFDLFKNLGNVNLTIVEKEDFKSCPIKLVYITTGGTAAQFKEIAKEEEGPFYLITTKGDNSLAASMEILSYLYENGKSGEIIHGSENYCAKRLNEIIKANTVYNDLHTLRFGIIGRPDLIASSSNNDMLLKRYGITQEDITMEEFFSEIDKKSYEENEYTKRLKNDNFDQSEVENALYIYGAVKRIALKYKYDGVAVRCFDLLTAYNNTGCLALAILNAEGIYAACEADSRSLLSMVIMGELSGNPCFMANPSTIDTEKDEIVLAHCVLPLNMPQSYKLMTHFESKLGVAIKGELKKTEYTLFKCWEDGEYFVRKATLVDNLCETNLCRTQVKLVTPNTKEYLTKPLANHQIICEGDNVGTVEEFFKLVNKN